MHQPIYEMGEESMKLISSRIRGSKEGPKSVVLASYLIERNQSLKYNSRWRFSIDVSSVVRKM